MRNKQTLATFWFKIQWLLLHWGTTDFFPRWMYFILSFVNTPSILSWVHPTVSWVFSWKSWDLDLHTFSFPFGLSTFISALEEFLALWGSIWTTNGSYTVSFKKLAFQWKHTQLHFLLAKLPGLGSYRMQEFISDPQHFKGEVSEC